MNLVITLQLTYEIDGECTLDHAAECVLADVLDGNPVPATASEKHDGTEDWALLLNEAKIISARIEE